MGAHDQIQDLQSRMAESIIGQEDVVERIVIGLLAVFDAFVNRAAHQ